MKLTEFIEKKEEFLTHLSVEKNVSKHTIAAYENDLQQFITFTTYLNEDDKNNLSLQQLVERYLITLFYRNMSKTSIARKFSAFKSFVIFLRKSGIQLKLNLQRPRIEKKLPIFLSFEQVIYLLDTIADHDLPTKKPLRDKAIFELLYATGIRVSELVHITMKDVDMENKTIRILGKGAKERIALFGKQAKERLKSYIDYERPTQHSIDEPLFINYEGKPLTPRSIQRIIKMFGSFLKFDKQLTPHKIRHTFATHLLNQGVDLRVVQELLGHKSLLSTQIYTHVSLENLAHMCDTKHPLSSKKV